MLFLPPLDMLSRLKGIETVFCHWQVFPLEVPSLDMLSRLKGIETFQERENGLRAHHFGYAFPFEGN